MNGFQLNILTRAETHSEKLSEWEQHFVESLLEQDQEEYELSDAQNKKLNDISTALIHKGVK